MNELRNYFELLGLEQCDLNQNESHSIDLYYILNPDKSVRWIWNSSNPNPDFLKFYSVASFRARLISWVYQLIFILRLQDWVFSKNKVSVKLNSNSILYSYLSSNFVLFTGTKGVNRKLILYTRDHEKEFVKIALNGDSFSLIRNEFSQLNKLEKINPKNFEVPKSELITDSILALNDISRKGSRAKNLSNLHFKALNEIYTHTCNNQSLRELECFKTSDEILLNMNEKAKSKLPHGLLKKMEALRNSFENTIVRLNLSHGDFTPWNVYAQKNKIAIYDWELSKNNMPFGYDLFHFIMQKSILIEHKNWHEIKRELIATFHSYSFTNKAFKELDFETYFSYYLYINTAYYLSVYSKQEEWHEQVYWLLDIWNQAVSDMTKKTIHPRENLISYIFDSLAHKSYAAIKFLDIQPELLSEYSDIDICIQRDEAYKLLNRLEQNVLIKKINKIEKSNMLSLNIILEDNSFLSIEFIWKFKRKGLVFMDSVDVLKNSFINAYNVKIMSIEDTKKYLMSFYGLNNGLIPEIYQHYFSSQELTQYSPKDIKSNALLSEENKGLNRIKNEFYYVIDVFKSFIHNHGMTITFSGVDGAGKSTIIEHTKYEIEKKFRKKVVVIRHRPSLLPILSVFSKGKKKAAEDVLNSLPRTGSNSSYLSSALRFGYYFIDYLIGQFVIFFKYILQGNVVLYDRYYYDFINDSKRSNILLPKWLIKFGYKFLLTPQLNFFLYADAETILSRKKELNAPTIQRLTGDYLNLFQQLNHNKNGQYIAIENIELKKTIQEINTQITQTLLIA